MGLHLRRSSGEASGSLEQPIDEWPFLDHYSGVNCIPLLTCQLHQGLLAQGAHLTHRCQGWTDDMVRQRGWAPEAD